MGGTVGRPGPGEGAGGQGGSVASDAGTDAASHPGDASAPSVGGASGSSGSGGAIGSGGAGTGGAGGFSGSGGGLTLPVMVTTYYFPSGWFGDVETMAAFTDPVRVPIKLKAPASDGPCAARVSGAVGQCMKVTYTPVPHAEAVRGYAGVALQGLPGMAAPRVVQGATVISAQVAGAIGGEMVDFTFGNREIDGFTGKVPATLTTTWQEVKFSLVGVAYDRISAPFTWGTESRTPITFYFDNVQIK